MKDIFFSLSIRSVRLNFLRSVIASVGIVIGVVAISAMGMLGTNMQLEVKDQLSSGADTIVITSDAVRMGPPGSAPMTSSSDSNALSKAVLTKIRTAVGNNGTVIPIYSTQTQFVINSVPGRGSVYGIDPGDITKFLTIANGTNIEGTNEALVGASIANNFNLKIGTRIRIGSDSTSSGTVVRIAGILKERGMSSDNVNADNAIIVSRDWYVDKYGGEDKYSQVNVIVRDIDTISQVEETIEAKVNTNEDNPVIRITDASSRISSISSSLATMTTFILAIGGISLLVAATSIFNVMMISVQERVQEIGVLMSIGTERGEIRRMFLYESLILGLLGAVVGGNHERDHRVTR